MEGIVREMLDDICGKDLFSSVIETLTKDPFTAYGSSISGLISTVYNIVMSVAMMIMFIYFLIGLVDKMSSENFTWEQLWKHLAMLLGAKVIIEHGLDIMMLMSKVGVELVGMINSGADPSFSASMNTSAIIDNFVGGLDGIYKVLAWILLLLYLIIPWIFSWVMGICVKIVCYTRLAEIYARACFAPIAFADFFKNGFQGNGWRFLKSFFAVCLQGAMIFTIAVLFSTLLRSFLDGTNSSDLFAFTGIYLAVGASSIMLMFRSSSLCKEIMGVN